MTDEPIVVVPITPSVIESEIEATEDDVDLVAEMVAAEGIQNELRHEQILEGVEECRNRLENLSASTMPTEQPLLNEMMVELRAIRERVSVVETMLRRNSESMPNSSNPDQSPSTPQAEIREEPSAEPSTEEPKPDARTKKYRRL